MSKEFNVKAFIGQTVKTNRVRSGGGRGKSSDTSQLQLLGIDGLKFIQDTMKANGSVKADDLVEIGSEWFRKEAVDWVLAKKQESAKTFTKVTVEDIDVEFVSGEFVRLSVLLDGVTSEKEFAERFNGACGYGEVYIRNEQFRCEWPLSEPVNVRRGDPKATDLAPILAPWSLLVEACEKFAVAQ